MKGNPRVNRSLADPMMDDIDHALGRPTDPLGETFRNYYAANTGGPEAAAFDASPWWRRGRSDASLTGYIVTDEGRQALADHLSALAGLKRGRGRT